MSKFFIVQAIYRTTLTILKWQECSRIKAMPLRLLMIRDRLRELAEPLLKLAATKSTPSNQRRVVCAAIRNNKLDEIICGPRHYDATMRNQIGDRLSNWYSAQQGFVDQHGKFLTREEAWVIAEAAGQIVRRVGGDGVRLFSENLY